MSEKTPGGACIIHTFATFHHYPLRTLFYKSKVKYTISFTASYSQEEWRLHQVLFFPLSSLQDFRGNSGHLRCRDLGSKNAAIFSARQVWEEQTSKKKKKTKLVGQIEWERKIQIKRCCYKDKWVQQVRSEGDVWYAETLWVIRLSRRIY